MVDEFDRPLPDDADEADVVEQKQDVPGDDETTASATAAHAAARRARR